MDRKKRIYTSLVAAALVVSSFPAAVFAEEQGQENVTTPDAVVQADETSETNPEGGETTPESGETNPEGGETTPESGETNPEGGSEADKDPATEETQKVTVTFKVNGGGL